MQLHLVDVTPLLLGDGSPVRAASAVARLGDGWLVVQDDSTHAVWWRAGTLDRVRIFAPVGGHDVFDEATGTKHLKPDLEAACEVVVDGERGVLMLGSGSAPARRRGALVKLVNGVPVVYVAHLPALYDAVAGALDVRPQDLNLEGACVLGSTLRWFHRGLPSAGLPTGSIDVSLHQLLDAVRGRKAGETVELADPLSYDLGVVDGIGLAITDAVALGGRSVLVSAVAEATPNPRDDGPVVGSSLAVLEDGRPVASAPLPLVEGRVCKVEGLALVGRSERSVRVLATVDDDDPARASLAATLDLAW